MNVSKSFANSFNPVAFVAALNSVETSATTITRDIFAAHTAGKAGLALIVSAVARIEFTKAKLNVLRVACARARKQTSALHTIAIDVRGKSVSVVESASIARKAGAGRKSAKRRAKPDESANANSNLKLAHAQRDTAIESAKYLAAALKACGMTDERISAIGKGAAKAATVRVWMAESLATPIVTGKRVRRAAAKAA